MLEIDCQQIRNKADKEREIENLNYKVNEREYSECPLIKINRIKLNKNMEEENEAKEEEKQNEIVETLKTQIGSKNFQK